MPEFDIVRREVKSPSGKLVHLQESRGACQVPGQIRCCEGFEYPSLRLD